jgi:class 3 adenylate cyclase
MVTGRECAPAFIGAARANWAATTSGDVNIVARVGDAAKAGQVLVSDAALERIAVDGLSVGRRRRLRADGAPRDMHVARVSRA